MIIAGLQNLTLPFPHCVTLKIYFSFLGLSFFTDKMRMSKASLRFNTSLSSKYHH